MGKITRTQTTNYKSYFILDVNEAPTDIQLSPSTLAENSPAGTVIGSIIVTDPDINSTASCTIIEGDNGYLVINGLQLVAGAKKVDYEALDSTKNLTFTLNCTDQYNHFVVEKLQVAVTG